MVERNEKNCLSRLPCFLFFLLCAPQPAEGNAALDPNVHLVGPKRKGFFFFVLFVIYQIPYGFFFLHMSDLTVHQFKDILQFQKFLYGILN